MGAAGNKGLQNEIQSANIIQSFDDSPISPRENNLNRVKMFEERNRQEVTSNCSENPRRKEYTSRQRIDEGNMVEQEFQEINESFKEYKIVQSETKKGRDLNFRSNSEKNISSPIQAAISFRNSSITRFSNENDDNKFGDVNQTFISSNDGFVHTSRYNKGEKYYSPNKMRYMTQKSSSEPTSPIDPISNEDKIPVIQLSPLRGTSSSSSHNSPFLGSFEHSRALLDLQRQKTIISFQNAKVGRRFFLHV